MNYYRRRQRIQITKIIAVIILTILISFGFVFLVKELSKEVEAKRDVIISKFNDVVKEYKKGSASKSNNIYSPSCVDGKKIIIVNGVTYYAGTVDTWGDIKGVKCE